jgi:predicted PurR-regulated permease PerM
VTDTVRSEGVMGLLDHLPGPLQDGARKLIDRLELEEEILGQRLEEQVTAQGGKAARAVSGFLSATGTVVVQVVMMLIALFFLLVDGRRLVTWLEEVAPLRPGQVREILVEFRKVSVAVLVSSMATAAVQALAALLGYLIARAPHPFFFAFATFLVAFVPAVGAAGVVLVVAGLLAVTGHTVAAIFLVIWGVAVVGLVDNIIKPILVKRGLELHGAVVFFALLGGLAVFGTIGLLLGPLVVAFFLALVRIHRREYGASGPAAPDPPCV